MAADKQRESQKLGVLMIDFSPVVREGLQAILTKDEQIEVLGDAADGSEALQLFDINADVQEVRHHRTRYHCLDDIKSSAAIRDNMQKALNHWCHSALMPSSTAVISCRLVVDRHAITA